MEIALYVFQADQVKGDHDCMQYPHKNWKQEETGCKSNT